MEKVCDVTHMWPNMGKYECGYSIKTTAVECHPNLSLLGKMRVKFYRRKAVSTLGTIIRALCNNKPTISLKGTAIRTIVKDCLR
ncbi:hypothetical protein CEXT_646361 [Caerostris extrusa]|uniref:Uncharacterized protein n=1 Tax=Caerostris extrusa TaxID=172846 RepID=A0AAV4M8W0_CAEEX|nr:hypothetical protein CEXT_646361 [Caerostris extrusa]